MEKDEVREQTEKHTSGPVTNHEQLIVKDYSGCSSDCQPRSVALWEASVLLLLSAIVFSRALSATELCWMDDNENIPLRFGPHPKFTMDNLKLCFQSCIGVTEPVGTFVKLLLCVAVGSSEKPFIHHAVSQLLHGANALLLLVWLRRVFRGQLREVQFGTLVATVWWTVHPLRAETIGWVSCQPYLLAGFFSLVGLLAFEEGLFVVTFLCSALAAHSKVTAAVLVVPVAVRTIDSCRKGLLASALLLLALLASGASAFFVHMAAFNNYVLEYMFEQPSDAPPLWPQRIVRGCYTFWYAVIHQLYPPGLCGRPWLAPVYKHRLSLTDPLFGACFWGLAILLLVVSVALLCGIPTLWARFRARNPACGATKPALPLWLAVSLFWVAFLTTLFPAMKVFAQHGDPGLMAGSRYSYLPDLFVTAPASAGLLSRIAERSKLCRGASNSRLPSLSATIGLAILSGFMVFQAWWCRWYIETWRTSEGVYMQTLSVNPLESYSAYNYAFYMSERGLEVTEGNKLIEDIERYRRAIDVAKAAGDDRIIMRASNDLGTFLNQADGDSLSEAEHFFSHALTLLQRNPSSEYRDLSFSLPYNFGHTMVKLGRLDRALLLYEQAANAYMSPARWEGFRNAAALAIQLGKFRRARKLAFQGLQVKPDCEACKQMIAHVDSLRGGR
eukprot:TRINITY_DN28300_c0_g1_i1.p1 TRINITY_DN28300_c0_g1~~TRINITY_DN28300_c0_g1_i1.p1  ORF type:complete len:671 (+),score=81.40 TRINITY_DN28300_c0_g1_i1:200-2212(+)